MIFIIFFLLFQAKLETKALKAKRPGFTDDRYNETSYYIENGKSDFLHFDLDNTIWKTGQNYLTQHLFPYKIKVKYKNNIEREIHKADSKKITDMKLEHDKATSNKVQNRFTNKIVSKQNKQLQENDNTYIIVKQKQIRK